MVTISEEVEVLEGESVCVLLYAKSRTIVLPVNVFNVIYLKHKIVVLFVLINGLNKILNLFFLS